MKNTILRTESEFLSDIKNYSIICHTTDVYSTVDVPDVVKKINPLGRNKLIGLHEETRYNKVEIKNGNVSFLLVVGEKVISQLLLWQKMKECTKTIIDDSSATYTINMENVEQALELTCYKLK